MKYQYYDPVKHWTKIRPHLKAVEPVLVRDFNRYTWGRWRQKFEPGMVPAKFESCDWRWSRPGRHPAYWDYVKHAACHWLVNHGLELAQRVEPERKWFILTSQLHSTVYDGRGTLFDLNFCALGISAPEAYRLANEERLAPGEHLKVHLAEHWRAEFRRTQVTTSSSDCFADAAPAPGSRLLRAPKAAAP